MVDQIDQMEIGSTGLSRSGGRVTEEFLPALRGSRARKVWREMEDNDPIVGALLFGIERLMAGLDWRVEAADETPEAVLLRDFVESCLHDMSESWDSTLNEILSMLPQGFAPMEVVYKQRVGPDEEDSTRRSRYSDNLIGWRKWSIRAQETISEWAFDDGGGLVGLYQTDNAVSGGRVFIPIEKLLLFRTTQAKNNPEGRSILRNAYRPWSFKRRIEEYEAIGVERDLAGLPVGWLPPEYLHPDADSNKKAITEAVQNIVTGIKRNETAGVVFPKVYDENGNPAMDLTLLSSGGSRQFDTDRIVTRYDERIAMTVLADFILLGHSATGTYALGQSKVDLFAQALASWATAIAEVVNLHAIPRLLRLNGMNTALAPSFGIGDVSTIDLEQLAKFVSSVGAAGALTFDDRIETHLRAVAGLPPLESPTMREDRNDDDDDDEPEMAMDDVDDEDEDEDDQ